MLRYNITIMGSSARYRCDLSRRFTGDRRGDADTNEHAALSHLPSAMQPRAGDRSLIDTTLPALSLMFVLGVRHGLDPDHVAVIDNIVFRMVEIRPCLSGWAGTLFAFGHGLAVAAVVLGVSVLSVWIALPSWIGGVIDAMVIALLTLVGTLNVVALLRRREYVPVGWRSRLLPAPLRSSTHPAAVMLIGVIFGLVFDTATQAAAWGAAATTHGGILATASITLAFTFGMLLADTCDSQIVSQLLRTTRDGGAGVQRYRQIVGWLIVTLSYGMALFALLEALGVQIEIGDIGFTAVGLTAALSVVLMLIWARWVSRRISLSENKK